jgi:hypothetical protein
MRYEDKTQMKRGMSAFFGNHKKDQNKVWKTSIYWKWKKCIRCVWRSVIPNEFKESPLLIVWLFLRLKKHEGKRNLKL